MIRRNTVTILTHGCSYQKEICCGLCEEHVKRRSVLLDTHIELTHVDINREGQHPWDVCV